MRVPLPDECFDLIWVDDGSLWLSGPESTSWSRDYPPGSNAVGVRFRPAVGPAVLGIAGSEVRDARVALDAVRPSREVRALAERLAEQMDDGRRMETLEAAVHPLAATARPVDAATLAVAAEFDRQPWGSLRETACRSGLSERQMHRRCTAAFGYGPAVLVRIRRLQRALSLARSAQGRPRRLAELAAAAGYFDQQHLAHEVRAVFGTTPSALFAVTGPAGMSDPYKTRGV